MERLKPPASFNFDDENLPREWKKWKKHFEFYLIATETDGKSNKVKSAILLSSIGNKGREIFDTFTFAEEAQRQDLEAVLQKFEDYCSPRKNITMQRYKNFQI